MMLWSSTSGRNGAFGTQYGSTVVQVCADGTAEGSRCSRRMTEIPGVLTKASQRNIRWPENFMMEKRRHEEISWILERSLSRTLLSFNEVFCIDTFMLKDYGKHLGSYKPKHIRRIYSPKWANKKMISTGTLTAILTRISHLWQPFWRKYEHVSDLSP